MFPSFFMKPQSEFTSYLTEGGFSGDKKNDFANKINQIIKREPTLFYLLRALENNSKLKVTMCFTLSIMLENQII